MLYYLFGCVTPVSVTVQVKSGEISRAEGVYEKTLTQQEEQDLWTKKTVDSGGIILKSDSNYVDNNVYEWVLNCNLSKK